MFIRIGKLQFGVVSAALLYAALWHAGCAKAAAVQDFSLSYTTDHGINLIIPNRKPKHIQSATPLNSTLAGTERSECKDVNDGRTSYVTANASAIVDLTNSHHIQIGLASQSTAMGGHFRTCVVGCDPVGDNCIGIVGHDTTADASSFAHVESRIAFSSEILQSHYNLLISRTHPEQSTITVTLPGGKVLIPGETATQLALNVKPSDVIYVDVELSSTATDTGGCCQVSENKDSQIDLDVQKAPILDAEKDEEPYIVGGSPTTSYKYVVAIYIQGKLQCTGTVIGKRTILTAAHCIDRFEDRLKAGQFSYTLGSDITSPTYGPKQITAADYPRGSDTIQYNPVSYIHDIGVLYTPDDIPVEPAVLHTLDPKWISILRKVDLYFVGFGYSRDASGAQVGVGVKREAPWIIQSADDWRFYYNSSRTHACRGDSGGPAFYQEVSTGKLLLMGITSLGNKNCVGGGVDTRVDAYHEWLSSRVR